MRLRRNQGLCGCLVALGMMLALGAPLRVQAGVPEPPVTFYGKVFDKSGVLLTSGNLTFIFTPAAGGNPTSFTTALMALHDPTQGDFSYVLDLRCESAIPAQAVGPAALPLAATPATYSFSATLDGVSASVWPSAVTSFSFSLADRASVRAMDLKVYQSTLPAQPSAPLPADGASSIAVTIALDWADAASASSYDLYLWPASQKQPLSPTATGLTASTWTPVAPLATLTQYNWQVVARNAYGQTPGPIWTFRTLPPPPALPASPSPALNALNIPNTTALGWAACANTASYEIYLWRATDPVPTVPTASGLTTSAWTPAAPLEYGRTYHWKVIAVNGAQRTTGSEWVFTTAAQPTCTLTVVSSHGTPLPAVGAHVYTSGTLVSFQLAGSPEVDTTGTTRWVCTGWMAPGLTPSSGTGVNGSFKLNKSATLTWNWKKQFLLTTTVTPTESGSVMLADGKTPAAGWYDATQLLNLYAVPVTNYRFSYWWGDLRGGTDRMSLTMDRPHSVLAYFRGLSTGVSDWWLYRE